MPRPRRPLTLLEQYRGLKLLIEVDNLKRWLASWRSGKPTIARTGAPGGPSSMGIVMAEFEQRRASGRCESSREAEANILAAWLKETHPAMPPLKAKSIRNKLPPDFQPFSHCPKL